MREVAVVPKRGFEEGKKPMAGVQPEFLSLRRIWQAVVLILVGTCWSPPEAAALVISEIHYNPRAGDNALEFIELTNESLGPVDLSGYAFVEGIHFEFPAGTLLAPKEIIVVCADADAVRGRFGISNVLGNYEGRLDASGERVSLANHVGVILQSIRYADDGKWPVGPDGMGHTLSLTNILFDPTEPESWTQSAELDGTPGFPNFPGPGEERFEETVLLDAGEEWQYRKGTEAFSTPPDAWREAGFDDGLWPVGPSGFGFGDDGIGTLLEDMRGNYTSVAIRKRFTLSEDLFEGRTQFLLGINYDDGFCAFLNGMELAQGQCPAEVLWSANATRSREATEEQMFVIPQSLIGAGANVLAIVGYNRTMNGSDFSLLPRLLHRRFPEPMESTELRVTFNELRRSAADGGGWVELYNQGGAAADLSGLRLSDDPDGPQSYVFPEETMIPPGGFLLVDEAASGLALSQPSVRLFLRGDDDRVIAAAAFSADPPEGLAAGSWAEALFPDGEPSSWITPTPTPGAANLIPRITDVVIHEIFYHPPEERDGEFIELYNRGVEPVDVAGFRFSKGIDYTFPAGTLINPGAYLVLAEDPELLREHHGVTGALGPYEGTLANGGENVRLVDRLGNLVDEVRYFDGGLWPVWADGRGSSLELIDPRQDNDFATAWEASEEGDKAEWEQHFFEAPNYKPATESELNILLVEKGVCRIDEISIVGTRFEDTPVVDAGEDWRYFKGTQPFSAPPEAWREVTFDDSAWLVGPSGFGFGDDDDATILADMEGNYSSIVVRKSFSISQELLEAPGVFELGVSYDDGFCAFLNGVEIALANCPADPSFEATARTSHEAREETRWPIPTELLQSEGNILAIAGFNRRVEDRDFTLIPRVLHRRAVGKSDNRLANPGFEEGTAPWRIEGTHVHSTRITHDKQMGNACLELVTTGKGDTLCNRIETDITPELEEGAYDVSLWTRWQRGSSLLVVHGEFSPGPWTGGRDTNYSGNTLAARLRLSVPFNLGTPGAENSVSRTLREETGSGNLGPVISDVQHDPPIPDVGREVTLRARVSAADGVARVQAFFRVDTPETSFDAIDLFDDGAHADGRSGDGIYGGTLPAVFTEGATVVFYIEAIDTIDATRRFPVAAPENPLVYIVRGRTGAEIQLVLDSVRSAELASRPLHSNELIDGTLVLEDDQVFYNIGLRYRGSPWGRNGRQGFRVRVGKERLYPGELRDINLKQHDLTDGPSNYLLARAGTVENPVMTSDYQYVNAFLNTTRVGTNTGLFNPVDKALVERWYGPEAAADAIVMKANGRMRFTDNCARTDPFWDDASMNHMLDNTENYRFYWFHNLHQTRDNWEPWISLTRLVDASATPDDAELDRRLPEHLDIEAFYRVIAPRVLMNDTDGLFLGNGHNGYVFWDPRDELWELIPQDMGVGWREQRSNLFSFTDPHARRITERPEPQRIYLRVLHEYLQGAWNSERAAPYVEALPREATSGRSGIGVLSFIDTSATNFTRRLEPFVDLPLRIVTNNGEDFATAAASVVLEGEAPVQLFSLALRRDAGAPEALEPEWLSATEWRLSLELNVGPQDLEILGLDAEDLVVEAVSINITRGEGMPFVRGDANVDQRLNLSDAVAILAAMFRDLQLSCLDAGDVDDSGSLEVTDAIALLNFLFLRGPPPAPPFPVAGADPTEDALPCDG